MDQRRYPVCTILLAAILGAGVAGCRSGPAPQTEGLSSTATVTRGAIAQVVQMSGQIAATNSRTLTISRFGGQVLEVPVRPGQAVQKGQALLRLDTTGQERELREAEADLKVAEAQLADAQRGGVEVEAAKAAADLAAAEAQLGAARLKLALAEQAGSAPLEQAVADDQVALQLAQDQLRQAELGSGASSIRTLEYQQAFFQRVLRDLQPGEDPADAQGALVAVERDLAAARAGRESALHAAADQVAQARQKLEKDRATLARVKAGQEDASLGARLELEQATAAVDKSRKAADELKSGADSAAVKAAKTVYEAAKARSEDARSAIAEATLTAPFDGLVFAVMVKAGVEMQPNAEAIYVADTKDLRVKAQATELDIPRLTVGQAVRVTFDAYPGQLFTGQILSLPATGLDAGGITIYEVETSLEKGEAQLWPGLGANVRAVIGEKKDVLAVPVAALRYRPPEEAYVVVRTADGKTHDQKVRIGLNDGIMAEVLDGLTEGQVVVIPLVPPMQPRPGFYGGPMG